MNTTPTSPQRQELPVSGTMLAQAVQDELRKTSSALTKLHCYDRQWENYFVWDRVTAPYGDWNQYNPWGQSAPSGPQNGRVPLSKYVFN